MCPKQYLRCCAFKLSCTIGDYQYLHIMSNMKLETHKRERLGADIFTQVIDSSKATELITHFDKLILLKMSRIEC